MATEEETKAAAPAPEVLATPGTKRTALEAAKLNADNIKDKVVLITGAYSGIGVETTIALLAEGAKVIVGGRNPKLQNDFEAQLKKEFSEDKVDGHTIDLGDLATVKEFAKYVSDKYEKIDVLILNAGIMATPPGLTKDGYEQQMGVNVIGHFLLAKLLAPKTKRQVWLSSTGHKLAGSPRIDTEYIKSFKVENKGYDSWKAYQQSKLGNILLAKEFGKEYPDMETCAVHPGAINTNLGRHMGVMSTLKFLVTGLPSLLKHGEGMSGMKSAQVGASTSVTCASMPSDKMKQGAYYSDCEIANESESARNEEDAKALYEYCQSETAKFQ